MNRREAMAAALLLLPGAATAATPEEFSSLTEDITPKPSDLLPGQLYLASTTRYRCRLCGLEYDGWSTHTMIVETGVEGERYGTCWTLLGRKLFDAGAAVRMTPRVKP